MRIGEISEKTGLSISNIRFYERKGLIGPDREADSKYRKYTEEDLNRLKQILLYRKMDFSIEVIGGILEGKIKPEEAIAQQICKLENKKSCIQSSIDLCKKVVSDGNYSSNDAEYYLSYVKEEEKRGKVFAPVDVFIEGASDFSEFLFSGTPIDLWLLQYLGIKKSVLLLMLALVVMVPVIGIVEDIIEGNGIGLGAILLCTLWWGFFAYMFVQYRKFRRTYP